MVIVQLLVKQRKLIRSPFNLNFLPDQVSAYIRKTLQTEGVQLKLSPSRKSKLGDYRFNRRTGIHQISVNIDLDEEEFFVTYLHELAHKKCFDRYGNKVAPHGVEWKLEFQKLLLEAKEKLDLPEHIEKEINKSVKSPRASKPYVPRESEFVVKDLNVGDIFELNSGKQFKLMQRRRTRFLCEEVVSKKKYTVAGLAPVTKILKK